MRTHRIGSPTRAQGLSIAAAFVLTSALGLAQLSLVARWLTPDMNAQFLALWGLIFAFGSVLGSMEQEVAKQSTESSMSGSRVPRSAVQAVIVATSGVAATLGVLLVTAPGRDLVEESSTIVALVLLSVLGFAGLILTRGVLLGTQRIWSYVLVLVGEGLLRVLLVGVVVGGDSVASLQWAVAGIVIGCFSWLAVAARLVRSIDWRGALLPWSQVTSTVAALAVANGLTAIVLSGFPTVATMAIGHPSELADLFAVLTFSRVPLILLTPVQALTVPVVVRWIRTGQTARLTSAIRRLTAGAVVLAALGGAGGYVLGPWAVRLLMGDQYDPSRVMTGVVLAATCVLGVTLIQAAVIIALGRYWVLTTCWAVTVLASLLTMLVLPWSPEARGTAAFAAAACTAGAVIGAALHRCRRAGVRSGADERG